MKGLIPAVLAATLVLAGCQTQQPRPGSATVAFSGETHADPQLRADTLRTLAIIVGARGCRSMEHVTAHVRHFEPSSGRKGHVWGEEDWQAQGCGNSYPFHISFTEDGRGGTYFHITPAQP